MTASFSDVDTVVLDAQALSLWLDQDRDFLADVHGMFASNVELVVCANTLIELANHTQHRRLGWLVSRTRVEPVTAEVASTAAALLRAAGMSGHKHAIDASVVAVALNRPGSTMIVTSDADDMDRLGQGRVVVMAV